MGLAHHLKVGSVSSGRTRVGRPSCWPNTKCYICLDGQDAEPALKESIFGWYVRVERLMS